MRNLNIIFFIGVFSFLLLEGCTKQDSSINEDREKVVMRKIGHEILLNANDSISVVRPIIHEGDKYRIQFEAQFSFLPDTLVKTIEAVVENTLPYNNYLVQVEECETNQVVYSYEYKLEEFSAFPEVVVACGTREQPLACYEIIIQFFEKENKTSANTWLYIILIILATAIVIFSYLKRKHTINDGSIKIGAYLFNPKKMTLTLTEKTVELTSKESELLNLLYEHINETVDRDIILNKVWGDEGDYVGRTLDVYVSKLRKKLENDSSIQLKNIRGIGYKLIVE